LMANLYHVNGPIDMRVWKGLLRFSVKVRVRINVRVRVH
jgi:hypothetical protein